MTDEEKMQRALELKNALHVLGKTKMEKQKQGELKPSEMHLFFVLGNGYEEEAVKPSEIAKRLDITLPAVSHHINSLEKSGYIERVSDPNDKRISRIRLSEKGKEYDAKLKNAFFETVLNLIEFLGEKDSEEIIRLIDKVSTFLKTCEEKKE